MKRIIIGSIIFVFYTCIIWLTGIYYYKTNIRKTYFRIIKKTEIEYISKNINYNRMDRAELVRNYKYFVEFSPYLDGYFVDDQLVIEANLGNRKWIRKFRIKIDK